MNDIQTLLQAWGPGLVFVNVLLEQAGAPIPAYPLLVAAGALPSGSVWLSLVLGVLGCLLADLAWYLAGRRYGSGLLSTVCRVSLSKDSCIRQTQSLYLRVGVRILLVAKFLPGASGLSTVMAGLTRTPLRSFLLYDMLGAVIWVGSALLLGALFKDAVVQVVQWLGDYGPMGIALVLTLLAIYVLVRTVRRYTLRQAMKHVPRLSVDELLRWQNEGRDTLILDVRAEAPAGPRIRGARAVDARVPIKALEIGDWTGDIVVVCACPDEVSAAALAVRLRRAGHAGIWALSGGYDAWSSQAPDRVE
ncbi:Rhodanese-related sulfurtransferase [plant metagenome]|uniref:Rhodanese-related sulfurtransferase n=1 Tax=plant metagenome TaxID=1297885 RepID=A0A484QQQ2_9ZZZZ